MRRERERGVLEEEGREGKKGKERRGEERKEKGGETSMR